MFNSWYRGRNVRAVLLCLIVLGLFAVPAGAATQARRAGQIPSSIPEITCPGDATVDCPELTDPSVTGYPAISGGVPPYDTTYADEKILGRCALTRTWSVTDAAGATDDCAQMISIQDTIPPVFLFCPADTVISCQADFWDLPHAIVTDNCDGDLEVLFEFTKIPEGCPDRLTFLREWHATDDCGNLSTCQQAVRVRDRQAPVLTCAPDEGVGCNDDIVFTNPGIIDNCDPDPVLRIESTLTEPGPGECEQTHTRTWIGEDACGNVSEPCSQNIVQVFDETPPTLVCVDDKRIGCNEEVVFDPPTALDNCDPSPVVSVMSTTMDPGPGQCEETHTRTWEAEDACRNISAPCSQSITRVVDTEPPVLTAAADKALPCNAPVVFDPPEITDNCDPDPALEVISTVISDGPEICVEIHTRCWVGTDACGNVSDQVCQSVTVKVDTEAPVLTCAPDKTIPHGEEPIFDEPTVTDNCLVSTDIVETSNTVTSDPETQEEIYEKCWIISDDCGNLSNECCQTITVEGPPPPYCTFRCWDWGADCLEDPNHEVSTTPACIRDQYFYDLYPDGVMVGVEGVRTAVWTTPRALEEFLCSYGIPKVLARSYVNPKRYELLGVLVGEALCLRLNRDFSCAGYMAGLGYPSPDACYGDYVIPEEVPWFAGLTVDEFLGVCDQVLSGNTGILRDYGANIDHLHTVAVHVNWLFSGCSGNQTEPPILLGGNGESIPEAEPANEGLPTQISLSVQPNPLYGSTTMRLALPVDAEVSVAVYDIQGRQVASLMSGHKTAGFHEVVWEACDGNANAVVPGVYFCRVEVGGEAAQLRKLIKM